MAGHFPQNRNSQEAVYVLMNYLLNMIHTDFLCIHAGTGQTTYEPLHYTGA